MVITKVLKLFSKKHNLVRKKIVIFIHSSALFAHLCDFALFCLTERDVPYQERWNRKRSMLEGHLKPRMMRRSHRHRGCGIFSPEVNVEHLHSTFVPAASVPSVLNNPEELALEEAIRRSLDDVVVAANENIETEIPAEIEKDDDVATTELSEIVVEPDIAVSTGSVCDEVNHCDKETSFATQAVGSGAVAEFVGETLDRMSEAIDELNRDVMAKGDLIFERDTIQDAESEYDSDDDSSGSKIVDGEEDAASTGSWSVVVEKEHASVEDGGLGRAAEAIGSALFQSDMMRSVEGVSTTMSSVTTVPTVAPSIVISEHPPSSIQLERWAAQLEQLHELGFMNDIASVDALESLSAANIGVESSDEVTVQQVIQKLMGD